MRFLPGAKVSEGVMRPDRGHHRGAGWYSGYVLEPWSLTAHAQCQLMPDSLSDLGQVTSLSYLKRHFISEVGNNSSLPKRISWV